MYRILRSSFTSILKKHCSKIAYTKRRVTLIFKLVTLTYYFYRTLILDYIHIHIYLTKRLLIVDIYFHKKVKQSRFIYWLKFLYRAEYVLYLMCAVLNKGRWM